MECRLVCKKWNNILSFNKYYLDYMKLNVYFNLGFTFNKLLKFNKTYFFNCLSKSDYKYNVIDIFWRFISEDYYNKHKNNLFNDNSTLNMEYIYNDKDEYGISMKYKNTKKDIWIKNNLKYLNIKYENLQHDLNIDVINLFLIYASEKEIKKYYHKLEIIGIKKLHILLNKQFDNTRNITYEKLKMISYMRDFHM